jgi:hypothetical protein
MYVEFIPPLPLPLAAANNIIRGNNFGASTALQLEPAAAFVNGGGNTYRSGPSFECSK